MQHRYRSVTRRQLYGPQTSSTKNAGPLPVRSLTLRPSAPLGNVTKRGKSRRARAGGGPSGSGRCPAPPCARHAARHRRTRSPHIHSSAISRLWCALDRPVRRGRKWPRTPDSHAMDSPLCEHRQGQLTPTVERATGTASLRWHALMAGHAQTHMAAPVRAPLTYARV